MLRRLAFCLAMIAAPPAFAQDASEAVVRLGRLENQVRQLSGQIEQLQYENRQLKEQVRKFQEDVEFRFQEGRGGASRGAPANPGGATPARPAQGQTPQRRSDAFDPNQAPEATGAPRPLGTTAPSAPLAQDVPSPRPDGQTFTRLKPPNPAAGQPGGASAPMPLPGGALSGADDLAEDEDPPAGNAPLDLNGTGRPAPAPAPARPSIAAVGSGDPQAEFDAAYAFIAQRQYEEAEMGFRRFLQSHPRDRLAPDAMFWLGESYLQRNRTREAAEQFLNVSTDHPKSPRAAEALLKLGTALNALGARDRACAVFAELDRKYPQAAPGVRQGSEREQKRIKCV
jgi:tol-pal system protein YbgF